MFAESLQLPFPLLSDFPDLRVTRQYGGLFLNATLAQVGIAERAFFLIEKEGIVRQRWLIKGGEEVVFPSEPLLQVERGRHLATLGVCHDCHTPKGPDGRPRLDRLLSGHPEGEPPAPVIPGAIAACLTATCFTGPWGTSFARNLTPDNATGIGA